MSSPASPVVTISRTYADLRRAVEAAYFAGQRAAERATIHASWLIGRLIHEHVMLFEHRADYGTRTIRRLAVDVEISERVLYRCWGFGRGYEILPPAAKLTCAHFFALSRLQAGPERKALTAQAQRHGWVAKELEKRVSAVLDAATGPAQDNAAGDLPGARPALPDAKSKLLTPMCGVPGFYNIVARDGGLAVDMGFKLYLGLTPAQARSRSAGEIVRVADDGSLSPPGETKPAPLFTYRAMIHRVVDGDTLAVGIALPYYAMDEKLRLRGIDAPEIDTLEGKAAKRFVESLLRDAQSVTIHTTKPDKYDRYLADVFVVTSRGEEVFLNNALLEAGHAERKDAWEFGDWEKLVLR